MLKLKIETDPKNKGYSESCFMMVDVCSVNRLYCIMLRSRLKKEDNNNTKIVEVKGNSKGKDIFQSNN